ncbi:MAG: MarR family transcriptional regulator [Clostridia bacterium]|nr:MarR family transcriptional regulator [Clostridia bacterium]
MDENQRRAMKLSSQLCFPLYAAARSIINLYTPYLQEIGITYTQYLVFLVLWEKDGIPVGDIGKKLMLDSGTLSPLLKKMQSAGYIERRRSGDDDRVVVVSLTAAGRELQERAKEIPQKVGGCVRLSPEKARTLYSILYELLENGGAAENQDKTD